jgi:hypothetical protein
MTLMGRHYEFPQRGKINGKLLLLLLLHYFIHEAYSRIAIKREWNQNLLMPEKWTENQSTVLYHIAWRHSQLTVS